MKRIFLALIACLAQQTIAQFTTNVPRPVVTIERLEGGVFVDHSAEIGRLYRLESSTTLTNWTLVSEYVADGTNMQFFIENTNITFNVPTNSGGTNGGPLPSPMSATLADSSTTGKPDKSLPLPYPWEKAYLPQHNNGGGGGNNSQPITQSSLAPNTEEHVFYRVLCPEVRIALPNYVPFVDQFLRLRVWTSVTNPGSTYRLMLSQDAVAIATNSGAVPASGTFGIEDASYNPAEWPNTGYYNADSWSLAVKITLPPPNQDQTIQVTFGWWQRKTFPSSRGLVANIHGSLIFVQGDWPLLDDDFNQEMINTYNFNLNGSYQMDLNFNFRDPPQTNPENILTTNDMSRFRFSLFTNPLSHLHFFGHGAPNKFGADEVGIITLNDLKNSRLTNQPMRYVALDGCEIVKKNTDMIAAFIGYKTKITRQDAATNGWTPGFGWGWTTKKQVGYLQKGLIYDKHFDYVFDFYYKLTERHPVSDRMIFTYKNAREYALDPQGAGSGGWMHNTEGEDWDYSGCYTCFFDDF